VFDLGRLQSNTTVVVTVPRSRRHFTLDGTELRSSTRRTTSVSTLQVHGESRFAILPTLVFSFLRDPTYSVRRDGDSSLLQRDSEGWRAFHPSVFLTLFWCDMDVNDGFERRCGGISDQGWARAIAFLPTITVGIPLDDTLLSSASAFVGASFNLPYVTLGIGAHLGGSVTTLREGFSIGNRYEIDSVETALYDGFATQFYLSVSLSPDVFEAFRSYQLVE
jgi:hypothetical protein